MPTDFEEQVAAQEPQGSGKDEHAREHTNGHDQADTGTAGEATDVVEISIFEKVWCGRTADEGRAARP